jgi:GNAT superfamily N-acetyltransferase
MDIKFRNYTKQAGITEDYYKVREFFIKLGYDEFSYARWDWMTTHSNLDKTSIGKIGLWEDKGDVVGIATFDTTLGNAYCLTLPDYSGLKEEMLRYAEKNLSGNDYFAIVIPDNDILYQDIATRSGYIATGDREYDAAFYIDRTSTSYELPVGFRITSLKDKLDLYQYRRVLWKGFNHEIDGEGPFSFSKEDELSATEEMVRPNVDLNLKIAVVSPEGNYVSYCGMWYEPRVGYAVVEPVATDPDYRRMGLGKAAVLEGIRRVGLMGAKVAYVGSSQQFYYSIGFRPFSSSTVWKRR